MFNVLYRERQILPTTHEAGELDFVCSPWVSAEKEAAGEKVLSAFANLGRGVASLFVWSPILILIFGVISALSLCQWLMAAFLGFLAVFFHVHWIKVHKDFPTNVKMDERGVRFCWKGNKSFESAVIPWNTIEGVDVDRSGPSSESDPFRSVSLVLKVRHSLFDNPKESDNLPFHLWHLGKSDYWIPNDLFSLTFPLDSLTLESDKHRMVSTFAECVHPGALSSKLLDLSRAKDVPSFTRLWLDDMQSFRRERITDLPPGAELNLGRYRIIGKLATGGQAQIYTALDVAENESVAIKELVLPISAGTEVRNRSFSNVKTEAMLLEKLHHPNIIRLLDSFVEDHRAYLVLEHASGHTLQRLVAERGSLSAAQVSKIASTLARLLAYLHRQSPPVVHRDFTPDNIILTDDQTIKLIDFNVAKQLESGSTKTVVGKHHYMAPEQFRGQPSAQSDLYSLGATLFYLLVGTEPLPLAQSKPREHNSSVPEKLDAIVQRLTALDLSERYATADQVELDLIDVT